MKNGVVFCPPKKGKDNRKGYVDQIKILAASKLAPTNSDRDTSARVLRKKKARAGALLACKQQGEKPPNHSGAQCYCVLGKKAGMPELKRKPHRSKNCFGKRPDQASAREGLGGNLGNRAAAVNQYHKSENKWKR